MKWSNRNYSFAFKKAIVGKVKPSGTPPKEWEAVCTLPGVPEGGRLGYYETEKDAMDVVERWVKGWATAFNDSLEEK